MLSSSVKRRIRHAADRVLNRFVPSYVGDRFQCTVCDTGLERFEPLDMYHLRELDRNQFVYPLFHAETLNIENYLCPRCHATDRDRLYALYFAQIIDPSKNYRMLDVAPSTPFRKHLRRYSNIDYRSADLYMEGVDDRVDITNMSGYADGAFDITLCSHVLEHIPDDLAAMREMYRVTETGGWGIMMVPINTAVETTHEDPSIIDEGLRWKYFGQDDHVRMYSKEDFIARLSSVGYRVEELDVTHFGYEAFERSGIHPRSVLYVVHK